MKLPPQLCAVLLVTKIGCLGHPQPQLVYYPYFSRDTTHHQPHQFGIGNAQGQGWTLLRTAPAKDSRHLGNADGGPRQGGGGSLGHGDESNPMDFPGHQKSRKNIRHDRFWPIITDNDQEKTIKIRCMTDAHVCSNSDGNTRRGWISSELDVLLASDNAFSSLSYSLVHQYEVFELENNYRPKLNEYIQLFFPMSTHIWRVMFLTNRTPWTCFCMFFRNMGGWVR